MSQEKVKNWTILTVTAAILALIFYFSKFYIEPLKNLFRREALWGTLIFLLITFLDVVIIVSPGLSVPLVPVAAEIFNVPVAVFLALFGWTIGAIVAFQIGRRYGLRAVSKFISRKKLEKARKIIPKNLFWAVFIIRIIFPVDIFSYAFGIFTRIDLRNFTLATILGLLPSAVGLAYLKNLPTWLGAVSLVAGFAAIVAAANYYSQKVSKINLL